MAKVLQMGKKRKCPPKCPCRFGNGRGFLSGWIGDPLGMPAHRLHQTTAWRKLAAEARARDEAHDAPCWLCGGAIDYDAPPRTRWSYSADHAVSVARTGDALCHLSELRPSHVSCNARRGSYQGHALQGHNVRPVRPTHRPRRPAVFTAW